MKNGDGFLLVYSLISQSSFTSIPSMIESISAARAYPQFPFMLVGTKSDLEDQREVTPQEGEALAHQYHTYALEVSAKSKKDVDEIFHTLLRMIVGRMAGINQGGCSLL
uniref:Uncharacterized protein n=1 Tax=Arcella intermedia TaxID=1963864 RepID=A0A6B2LU14_9EUKA|eukprot:TRINITY_DN9406_c0_g1_i1.p1 TRINITY_DN9406_c0_g1~~TRINITY_DN9406_c0_g1_i1.p1  ORF type:complete len:109 (-),score=34.98 TRINITY_DN9406_c0_g1_i1:8-334(-)